MHHLSWSYSAVHNVARLDKCMSVQLTKYKYVQNFVILSLRWMMELQSISVVMKIKTNKWVNSFKREILESLFFRKKKQPNKHFVIKWAQMLKWSTTVHLLIKTSNCWFMVYVFFSRTKLSLLYLTNCIYSCFKRPLLSAVGIICSALRPLCANMCNCIHKR